MVGPRGWRIGISFTKVGRSVCCLLLDVILFYYLNSTCLLLFYIVDEHYSGNRSRNAIVRQDLPTAKEEQEREIREAEERYSAFIKEQ